MKRIPLLISALVLVSPTACTSLHSVAEAPAPRQEQAMPSPDSVALEQETESPETPPSTEDKPSEPEKREEPKPAPAKKESPPESSKSQEATKESPGKNKVETTRKTTPSQEKKPASSTNDDQLHPYEAEVIRLVNEERKKRGLSPLKTNPEVSRLARMKSDDMRKNGYFSHQSPTLGSPFDMLKRAGIRYRLAGENIAAGQRTPKDVINSWMNSEGHRANILNPNYTEIGVGYVTGGNYGTYWTQLFITQ
ncbi:CAP domain-containing protein [Staphylospora marina]|uniref:CAP domain-containing protein n=1 Tax=Staphylospora marina TaxID=2490858 RepID=UPI001F1565C9|nr:CAP domain-containing protein [Staphylospora marina]